MNVKLNKVLNDRLGATRNLFFMPSCGDESLPIGAAYYIFDELQINKTPLPDLFLGLEFTAEEVIHQIKENYREALIYKVSENIENEIATLLADYKVVARVYGRGEWGARSLGNRAVLANPSKMDSFHFVNNAVKMRDFWMPFAPSILDTHVDLYIEGNHPKQAKFMILGFDSTQVGRKHLVAATHQKDKTIRPQVVCAIENPSYHKILSKFEELSGIGGVLNTSYNLHGYPLADSMDSIFQTFLNSDLQYLAFQDILITKRNG